MNDSNRENFPNFPIKPKETPERVKKIRKRPLFLANPYYVILIFLGIFILSTIAYIIPTNIEEAQQPAQISQPLSMPLSTPLSTQNLKLYLKFDNSSNLGQDSSENNNNGSCSGAYCPTLNSSGKINGAGNFDGVNDYLKLSSEFVGTGADSICAWIYPTGWGEKGNGRIADNGKFIFVLHSDEKDIHLTSDGASHNAKSAKNSISLNTWQFVCATRNSSGIANVYVNGNLSGAANQNSGTPSAGVRSLYIGNEYQTSRTFKGRIDELRIYNRVLNASEIYELSLPSPCPSPSPSENILFIVDSDIAQNIKLKLDLFKNQLNKEYCWEITQKEFAPDTNRKLIKDFIIDFYNTKNLKGIYLIGNIPTGEYSGSILADYYYTDIYDQCKEINLTVKWLCRDLKKGIDLTMEYPCEQSGMITIQEIKKTLLSRELPCAMPYDENPFFVSRITPNSSEENNSDLIKNYFTNNLDYRTGKKIFQHKALIYIPISGEYQDFAFRARETEELKNYLTGKYKDVQTQGAFDDTQINVINSEQENSDEQFLQESKRNYEYLFYEGHGDPSSMQKNITIEKVRETSSLLGNFFSCSVGRFTEKDYIAGEFIFKGKMLFTDAASTPVGRSMSPSVGHFNYLLTRGIPIFEALAATTFSGYNLNNLGDISLKLANKPSSRTFNDPEINVPQTIDFGEIPNNNRSSTFFNIKNNGFSDLIIFNINLVFEVRDKNHRVIGLTWDITKNSFQLSSQEAITLNLGIQPVVSSSGDYFGKIIIVSNDPVFPIKKIPFKVKIIF